MRDLPHDHSRIINNRTDYAIRRIRRLHARAERDRTGLHSIEGMRFVARAIRHGAHIETLVACPPLLTHGFARRLVRWLRQAGTPVLVGTSPSAPVDYQKVAYNGPVLLLIGSERKGLPPDLLAACDVVVRSPMVGETDSLNLSVAASLLLYEVFNQRRAREPRSIT